MFLPSSKPDKTRLACESLTMTGWLLTVCVTISVLLPLPALAQPFTPADDDSVVDTLTPAIVELSADIRRQQTTSTTAEAAPAQILPQAMAAYQVAVSSGDARAYGHTLTILQRWPDDTPRPAMISILLAAVQQHNHAFDEALMQLRPLTTAQPQNVPRSAYIQALMIQSQIGLVIADYPLVESSCDALSSSARRPVYINCQAQLDGVTGNARQALSILNDTLITGADLSTLDYQELLITGAVMAHRVGELVLAEDYYQKALRLAPDNTYLLVSYARLLREQARHAELIALLPADSDQTLNAELSILVATALRARDTTADKHRAETIVSRLSRDFELAFLRNDAIPYKEYAQYSLDLADQPSDALRAARQNWALQKEPSDTRLLARAAAANNDQQTLTEIAQWINQMGTEDTRLQAILAGHQESSP